ncbi:hypothetical protein COB72_09820 [bacterium]|nr:MAG: hypothetical protein COB72_09820 [bacterium]
MMTQNQTDVQVPSQRPTRGLVVLNLALLAGLGLVTIAPDAGAQMGTPTSRARGEYSIVGGSTIGGVSSTIYVLDSANRELIALSWNDSAKSLDGIGYRDLSLDSSSDPDR